jgi:hypothetical protein
MAGTATDDLPGAIAEEQERRHQGKRLIRPGQTQFLTIDDAGRCLSMRSFSPRGLPLANDEDRRSWVDGACGRAEGGDGSGEEEVAVTEDWQSRLSGWRLSMPRQRGKVGRHAAAPSAVRA